ncbi:MAG: Hsp20/alpha crystallin family protein [Halobacterium sp.]
MVSRGSPFDELERLLDKMNDARERAGGGLAVDVEDEDDQFVVTTDLPGFDKDDIDVQVHERTLRIDATHEEETEEEAEDEDNYIRRERSKRSLSRSVTLPEDVDEEGASASFENGVLTIELPKAHTGEESTSVEIE